MSTEIWPQQLYDSLTRQNTVLETPITTIPQLLNAIASYNSDQRLQGRAFTAHKGYMSEGHGDFLRKLLEAFTAQREANDSHKTAINTYLTAHSHYDAQQIQRELNILATLIPAMRLTIPLTLVPSVRQLLQEQLDDLIDRQETVQDKCDDLQSFIAATSGIYDTPNSLFAAIDPLLVRIERTARCIFTGVVTMPTLAELDDIIAAKAVYATFFDNNGNLIYSEVGHLMSRGHENMSQAKFDALVMLFGDPSISHEALSRVYQHAFLNTPAEDFWTVHGTLVAIADALSESFMQNVDTWLWTGAFRDHTTRSEIEAMMQRIQVLYFIASLNNHDGLSNLTDHLDLSQLNDGTIRFFGVTGTLSTFQGLFFGTYAYDALEASIQRDFEAAVRRNPDLAGHLLAALQFIPHIKGAAGGISSAQSISKALQDALNLISQNSALSAAERELLQRMTALAIARLGGGAFSVHSSHSGYTLIGTTTMTNAAMINLAGLEAALFPTNTVISALATPDRMPATYSRVREFLHEGGARAFGNALNEIYHTHFESISSQFPHFELVITDDSTSLPLPVLQEIINIWGGGND